MLYLTFIGDIIIPELSCAIFKLVSEKKTMYSLFKKRVTDELCLYKYQYLNFLVKKKKKIPKRFVCLFNVRCEFV